MTLLETEWVIHLLFDLAIMCQYLSMLLYSASMTPHDFIYKHCRGKISQTVRKRLSGLLCRVSHCLQPSSLYSFMNAENPRQAAWWADFLHSSSEGFCSTQVFDSSRYCILQEEGESEQWRINQCKSFLPFYCWLYLHSIWVGCGAVFAHDEIRLSQM